MNRIDALAICPYYMRSAERTVTCEGLEEGYYHSLRFRDEGEKNIFFFDHCATYAYDRCPYCRAQEIRYDSREKQEET